MRASASASKTPARPDAAMTKGVDDRAAQKGASGIGADATRAALLALRRSLRGMIPCEADELVGRCRRWGGGRAWWVGGGRPMLADRCYREVSGGGRCLTKRWLPSILVAAEREKKKHASFIPAVMYSMTIL